MYSPCEVNAKERLLILGQLWGRKTKFDPNANSYKCLIFYKIGLSPYLCELHGAKPTADEFIQLSEHPEEFLEPIVPHPSPEVLIQVVDDRVHRPAIIARRQPPHLVLEALSGLGTDPNLACENLEA